MNYISFLSFIIKLGNLLELKYYQPAGKRGKGEEGVGSNEFLIKIWEKMNIMSVFFVGMLLNDNEFLYDNFYIKI